MDNLVLLWEWVSMAYAAETREYALTFSEQHHHIALHNEHLFSPGVYHSPESLWEPVIFMCFCFFPLCFTSDCSAVWQRIWPHGRCSIWGKLLFLWDDVSASGHKVRRHLVTSLLVLPGIPWDSGEITVRLFTLAQPESYCDRFIGSETFIQAEPLNQYTFALTHTLGRGGGEV